MTICDKCGSTMMKPGPAVISTQQFGLALCSAADAPFAMRDPIPADFCQRCTIHLMRKVLDEAERVVNGREAQEDSI